MTTLISSADRSVLLAGICLLAWLGPLDAAQAQELEPLGDPSPQPLLPVDDTGEPPLGRLGKPAPSVRSADAPERSLLDLSAGLSFIKRSYTLDSLDAGLALDSSFYSTVHVNAALFPLASSEGWLGDLGLVGSFLRGVDTTVADEGGVQRNIISRHSELSLGAAWRYQVMPQLQVRADTGIYLVDFVLSDNPFYSSTTYRAWWLGGQGEYTLSPWLRLDAQLGLYPVVSLGPSEEEFGESSSSFGAAFGLGAQVDLVGQVYLRTGYRGRWFSSSFQGRGTRGLEAVVTTDIFHDLALWAGFRL